MLDNEEETTTMTKSDFSVSIIGGGIGGLTLAIGLARAGVAVDIFEAAVSGPSVRQVEIQQASDLLLCPLSPPPLL